MEYVSKEKFKDLEKELVELKTKGRKQVSDALVYAKSLGDLSENAEYAQAREDQAKLEDRIQKLEHILQTAKVVTKHTSSVVEVGTTVILKKDDKSERTFSIVGAEEADTASGKISFHSPLGQALLGKKEGDKVDIKTPKGVVHYTVTEIK